MKAIIIRESGGPDALVLVDQPIPVPAPEEILVAIAAAGVNRRDVMQRTGQYPAPAGAPIVPGLEISGVVVCLGTSVTRWKVGDRVVALLLGGGYAEYCTVHETNALPLPEPLTLLEAAGIPETTFTVWHNVFQRGRLSRNEWLLVHGGTSGIGSTAIQLGKAFGAYVLTTTGSDEKSLTAKSLGADVTINRRTDDFVTATLMATNGNGADVILDMVGGISPDRNFNAAAEDGRLVQIGVLAGAVTRVDLWKLMTKRLTLTGSTLRNRSVAFKAALAREVEEAIWPIIAQGLYRPLVDNVFPLDQVADSHRRIDDDEHAGKIIISISTQPS